MPTLDTTPEPIHQLIRRNLQRHHTPETADRIHRRVIDALLDHERNESVVSALHQAAFRSRRPSPTVIDMLNSLFSDEPDCLDYAMQHFAAATSTAPDVLARLHQIGSPEVKQWVAVNPSTPDHIRDVHSGAAWTNPYTTEPATADPLSVPPVPAAYLASDGTVKISVYDLAATAHLPEKHAELCLKAAADMLSDTPIYDYIVDQLPNMSPSYASDIAIELALNPFTSPAQLHRVAQIDSPAARELIARRTDLLTDTRSHLTGYLPTPAPPAPDWSLDL